MTAADRLAFWRRWLVVVTTVVLAFGVALVVFARPAADAFELVYFRPRFGISLDPQAAAYAAFLQAVVGGSLAGWSVLILYVLAGPYRRRERVGWDMLAASLGLWFVLDTAYSLVSGFWPNAVLNAGLLAAFAIPLAATYRPFHSRG